MIRLPTRLEKIHSTLESNDVREKSLDGALLVIRGALAWIFIYYGAGKLFGWFHGGGLHSTAVFFATTAHLHPGLFFAVMSGVTEFFGGIAIGLGLFGRLVGVALFGDMVIAMITTTFQHGLIGNATGVGYGLNVAIAALAIAIVVLGSGRFSLDHKVRSLTRSRR